LKAKAILEPSEQNVTAYIMFQRKQLDRASMFSDVWQHSVWQNPDLDYTLQRPVSVVR
jgi:conjugal transfer pilus assembly protein TraF